MLDHLKLKRVGIFLGGVLFGTAGIKVLSGKRAKKVYTKGMAAALRAKDEVVKTATTVQEHTEDIIYEAKLINEERARREAAKAAAEASYAQGNSETDKNTEQAAYAEEMNKTEEPNE
ncbi:DUF6110 family protein [Microaceticoccus formicicus]|uniref:DUF6110 family protein n=1 Tax=Microaceticoccus formicicus TaxID=3118105 RepID=UPI003CD00941|nr:DUF6110 family protein [Peptoniphilaceae bacterium AMB_02]